MYGDSTKAISDHFLTRVDIMSERDTIPLSIGYRNKPTLLIVFVTGGRPAERIDYSQQIMHPIVCKLRHIADSVSMPNQILIRVICVTLRLPIRIG
jgi:hypothetical protein